MNGEYRERDWRAYWYAVCRRCETQAAHIGYYILGYTNDAELEVRTLGDGPMRQLRRLRRLRRLRDIVTVQFGKTTR